MVKNTLKFIFSLILSVTFNVVAQQGNRSFDSVRYIYAIANVKSDQIIIRWAPPNHIAWTRGNVSGYKVIRYRVNLEGRKPVEAKQIGNDTIKPFSLEEWKSKFPQDHPYAPIAVQALYGKQFRISEQNFDIANIRTLSQEQELRYSFALFTADMDAQVAEGLGLRVVDKNFEKDEQYLYVIIPYDVSQMDTGYVFVDTRLLTPVPKAPNLEKNEMENQIELRWSVENMQNVFTAFWIERSEDGKNWVRLNKTPYIQATQNPNQQDKYIYYTDTTISRNYLPYKYRLIGITPFAELSEPSEVIEAMGRDRTAPQPPVITSIKDVKGKIELEWKIENPPSDLKGFIIGRSNSIGGEYKPLTTQILEPSVRKFTDNSPDPINENYYVVFALDTANNASVSMPAYGFLIDSIPPAKPVGLTGSIDTLGIVRLHWPLGKDPDITGYRVYFANAIDHEFSNLTPYPIQDTVFVDTLNLNTLTKEIYYQIVAVDRNFNHSARSDILKLVKPDIVPPVPPLISDYLVTDSSVVLDIIPSLSDDVAKYIIFRKGGKEKDWTQILVLSRESLNKKKIIDNTVTGPNFYSYALQAVDSSGNKSELSPSVGVKVNQSIKVFQIEGLNASYDSQKKAIILTWMKPKSEVEYYVIYKRVNGGKFENFASVGPDKVNFTDTELIYQGEYQYGIKAVFKNNESPISFSPIVLVKY